MLDDEERARLATVADYQFGPGAGAALFPEEAATVTRSTSGRIAQVATPAGQEDGSRVVTYGTDGRFTLGIAGGVRLHDAIGRPAVTVGDESVRFVREGKNAFAKFVTDVDEDVRPGDEVLVVHDGDLLAVGRAELPAHAILDFDTGMAVKIRDGMDDYDG